MLRNKMSGFTLIELMVVIVIIGVLASLAIPRFSEASDKAKVAEAPRIMASFESAFLAAKAELGDSIGSMGDVIFDTAALKSRWFAYSSMQNGTKVEGFKGVTQGKVGKIADKSEFATQDTGGGLFIHCYGADDNVYAIGKKYVPNFLVDAKKPTACKTK